MDHASAGAWLEHGGEGKMKALYRHYGVMLEPW